MMGPSSYNVALGLANDLIDPPSDLRLGLHADNAIDLPACSKDQQCWNRAHVEARRCRRIFIDIEFRYADASGHFRRQFFNYRGNHLTRPAPGRPHIEEHRQRRALHLTRKCRIRYSHRLVVYQQRCLTAAAYRLEPVTEFLQWHSIGRTAARTANQLWISHFVYDLSRQGIAHRLHFFQIFVHELHRHRAFTDGGSDAFDRAGSDVAGSEDTGAASLEQKRLAPRRPVRRLR